MPALCNYFGQIIQKISRDVCWLPCSNGIESWLKRFVDTNANDWNLWTCVKCWGLAPWLRGNYSWLSYLFHKNKNSLASLSLSFFSHFPFCWPISQFCWVLFEKFVLNVFNDPRAYLSILYLLRSKQKCFCHFLFVSLFYSFWHFRLWNWWGGVEKFSTQPRKEWLYVNFWNS